MFHHALPLVFAITLMMAGTAGSAETAEIQLISDVQYGLVAGTNQNPPTKLLLDIALPAERSARLPAILFVHSGGWYMGERTQYHNEIREAASRGYVAATITYRLTGTTPEQPAHQFPVQIEDVKCAIRWLRSQADQYNIDPDRIGIKGSSAGGHLSLLAGVTDQNHPLEGSGGSAEYSSRVQAVVNYYGPTDLSRLHATSVKVAPMLERLLGGTPADVPDAYQLASPVSHLTPDDPPTLTIHGGRDKLVPVDQAIELDEKARAAGVPHQLMLLPEQAHGFGGDDRQRAIDASFAFFDQQLKSEQRLNAAERRRPNVILLMADDLGCGDTGYNGHPVIQTPHLDEMSRSGLRMNRFYAAAPVCSPTRGSCLTGRNASRFGIHTANDGSLPDREVCLAELLADHGYATGHFGKWHLGTLTTSMVDSNRGRPRNTTDYSPPWMNGFSTCFSTEALIPTWFGPADYQNQKTHYWRGPDQLADPAEITGDDSQILMNHADRFVRQVVADQKPFLAVIWFHTPHYPIAGSPEGRAAYQSSTDDQQHYFAAVTAMDQQIGRLRATLKELHADRNTMVWFCSDNGPEGNPGPKDRSQGTAGPLRGRKRSLYEGGIRVPGLLVWPEEIPAAAETSVPCVTSDYLPTIADAAGILLDSAVPRDGISLLPVIRKQTAERSHPIAFQFETQAVLSNNQYKLVHNTQLQRLKSDNGQTRIAEWELYDLTTDPGETINIADQHPDILKSMQAELQAWQESVRNDNVRSNTVR
jgi:arylsulfatase A-like enzyme/acetyl esterase/lipase